MESAAELLPRGVVLNVILLPMEGDPGASAAYWMLAGRIGGTYTSPFRDWP